MTTPLRISLGVCHGAERLGVRWQSGSGDTAFGRRMSLGISMRPVRAKAAWRCTSRRSPKHAGAKRGDSGTDRDLEVAST
jgi:hypothetical protein